MKPFEPISIETARELVDFGGGAMSPGLAEAQLEGAVSVHNLLARDGFAYLADEVGMGKTYVALGAVSLLRFFHPHLRVLYITPRENIQVKWKKEIQNFVRNNWKPIDQRVKSFQGTPAVEVTLCSNLADWARQANRNADRDFLVRMTSFSFPLGDDPRLWRKKRREILALAHYLERSDLDLRNKDAFKRAYAQAVNTLLPRYDVVVVDEAHNFKHGRKSQAARNRILRVLLGLGDDADDDVLEHYGRRFERVLFLSATPLESDYADLWRQLDLFGFGAGVRQLTDSEVEVSDKREIASRFLVRRLTGLKIGGKLHTKNMYRREWRGGGCVTHDDPLEIPDERQKLIVALVQKKVADVLQNERFGASFQMGMLASFESFLETAKVKKDDDSVFDASEQTDEELEKEGIDTPSVNLLAASYFREFGTSLPHPKMDSLVESLSGNLVSGEKALVFVRRVRSVDEIAEKLNRKYDAWLRADLERKLPGELGAQLGEAWGEYEAERRKRQRRTQASGNELEEEGNETTEGLLVEQERIDDPGGNDTFFAWFFRGDGPKKWLSGASFRTNRLQGTGSAYSTLFEDNHLAELLGSPENALEALAKTLGESVSACSERLRNLAYTTFHRASRQKKFPRLPVFRAYQAAALTRLAHSDSPLAPDARVALRGHYPGAAQQAGYPDVPPAFPPAREFIEARTFFTELRRRPKLRDEIWPESRKRELFERFEELERRRELLAATARLGHAFIDLWALAVGRIGSFRAGAQEKTGERAEALIEDYLDRLELQRDEPGFHAYRELREVAKHFDLLLAVNFPEVNEKALAELPRLFGRALAKQNPVGGMFGGVNGTLIRQFRMPGYPLVLVTTEVLQEGEDLHTFCSQVVHYGITWTPSAMEQRTGRVDRIGSLTHRRLDGAARAEPHELLQVYYPYLGDTVERLQVERIFEKMNRFIHLIHRTNGEDRDSRIHTKTEFVRQREIGQIVEKLESLFPVRKETLRGNHHEVSVAEIERAKVLAHFEGLAARLSERLRIDWEPRAGDFELFGEAFVQDQRLLPPDDRREVGTRGIRRQPFAFYLRSAGHVPVLHCVSPVGQVNDGDPEEIIELQEEIDGAKLCQVETRDVESYTLTAEGDVLFDPAGTAIEDVADLLVRVCVAADKVERELLQGQDAEIQKFRNDLVEEAHHVGD